MDLQRTRRSPTSQVSQQPIEKSSERSSGHRHPSLVWSHSLWCNTLLLAPEPAAPLPSLGKGSHGHKPMTLPSPDQCTSSSPALQGGLCPLRRAHTPPNHIHKASGRAVLPPNPSESRELPLCDGALAQEDSRVLDPLCSQQREVAQSWLNPGRAEIPALTPALTPSPGELSTTADRVRFH